MDGRRKGALALGTLVAVPLASAEAAEARLASDLGGGTPSVTEPSNEPTGDPPVGKRPPGRPANPTIDAGVPSRSVPLDGHPTTRRKPVAEPQNESPPRTRKYADDRREPLATPGRDVSGAGTNPTGDEPPPPVRERKRVRDVSGPTIGNQVRPPGAPRSADAAERYFKERQGESVDYTPPKELELGKSTLPGPGDRPGEPKPTIGNQVRPPGAPRTADPAERYFKARQGETVDYTPAVEPEVSDQSDEQDEEHEMSELPGPGYRYGDTPEGKIEEYEANGGGNDFDLTDALGGLKDQGSGFIKGTKESVVGAKDGLVSTYESMGMDVCLPLPPPAHSPCTSVTPPGVSDDEHEEAVDQRIRLFEFAIDNPGEFGKQAINWEDLKEGRYGEWLGGLAPDTLLSAVTGGAGGFGSRLLRTSGGKAPDTDTPDVDAPDGSRDTDSDGDADTDAPPVSDPRVDRLFGRYPQLRDTPENRTALAGILRDTRSGGQTRNTTREGTYIPSRTAGHASELRTLADLNSRPGVSQIDVLPSSSTGRSPDFVVTMADGRQNRVEVVTLTGRGANYQRRNQGRVAGPPKASAIRAAVMKKAKSTTAKRSQLDAPIKGVPAGGTIAVHMRGGAGAAGDLRVSVREAMAAARLKDSPHVKEVEFFLPDRTVVRYRRQSDGSYVAAP